MVLTKRMILAILISFISGCEFIYSQTTEINYETLLNESTEIFHMLETTKEDSIKYANTLFTFSKLCRKLGLSNHSLVIAATSSNILEKIQDQVGTIEEKFTLYTDLINVNNFIADLIGGRTYDTNASNIFPEMQSTIYSTKIATEGTDQIQEAMKRNDSVTVEKFKKYINDIPDNSITNSAIKWKNNDIEGALLEITNALQKNTDRITSEQKNTLQKRKNALISLQNISKKNLDECLEMAGNLYYPTTLSQLLYDQCLPDYYLMLKQIANLYEQHKKPQKALIVYEQLEASLVQQLKEDIPYLLPAEKTSLWLFMQPYFDEMQRFAYNNYSLPDIAKFLYTTNLLKKELFEVTSFDILNDITKEKDEISSSLIAQRDSLIADENTYKTNLGEDYVCAFKNAVLITILEKKLISYVKSKQNCMRNYNYNWEDIMSKLSPHEAVVDIIQILHPDASWKSDYWAIVFKGGDTSPHLVRMFPSSELAISYYSDNAYKKIWRPIEKYTKGCSDIYMAFEGYMHHYTFADIKVGNSFLCDKYNLHYLMSTKDVISLKSDSLFSETPKRDIFFFGGAEFGLPLSETDNKRGQGFAYLPGTVKEVNEISQLLPKNQWNIHKYIGKAATEKALKEIPDKPFSSGVLHISTHGFYLQYDKSISSNIIQKDGKSGLYEPLLRTGFVLTGGNEAWTNEYPMDGTDDGIVTAFEIGNLNLKNIEMVVLSTCRSGLGEIHDGEGLSGLIRAFRIAGVKNILVTLEDVSDNYTAEFMTHFYDLLCKTGNIHQAFIQTQREMKDMNSDGYSKKWAEFKLIE